MDCCSALLLLFILFVSCVILSYTRILKEKAALPPGPIPIPFLGNLLQMDTSDISGTLMKMKKKYGPVFTLYFGSKPGVVICGYKAVKEALVNQNDVFGDRGDYPAFSNFLGDHDISFANGDGWKHRRHFALTTLRHFGMGKRSVEDKILEEAQFLIKELKETKGSPVNPLFCLGRAVSNVTCVLLYGKRFDHRDKRLVAITESTFGNLLIMSSKWGALYNMYPSLMKFVPGPHKNLQKNYQVIDDITKEFVKNHEKTLDPENLRDYLDCFLVKIKEEKDNSDSAFNMKSLTATIQNLIFGGTVTVSATLFYGILILMKYPDVAERIQKEIDSVVGRDGSPSMADRTKMPYTEATLYELMRFCNLIPTSFPHRTTKDTVFSGFHIPKGTFVAPLLTSVHYDPECYSEPNKFNPNNFLDDKGLFKKNDAHMPFSAGKRICLGEGLARMEIFLFFTTLLQNFTFKPIVPRDGIDIRPTGTGLASIPPMYQCCILPR